VGNRRLSTQRQIIDITGATGIVYGVRLLATLRRIGIETHLVVSHAADMTRAYETRLSPKE
jgi:flavin prenyltransferase